MDMEAESSDSLDDKELDCIPNGDGSVCVKPWLWYSVQALNLFWEWAETACILTVFGLVSYLLFRIINALTDYWLSGTPAYESYKNDIKKKQIESLALDLSNTESERFMMKKQTDVLQEEIHVLCDMIARLRQAVDLKEKALQEARETQARFRRMKEKNDALYSSVMGKPRDPVPSEDNFMDAEIVTLEELLWQARYELHQVGSEVLPKKEAKVMKSVSDMIALARKEEKIRDELHAQGYEFEPTDLSTAREVTVHGDQSLDEMMEKYGRMRRAVGDGELPAVASEQGDGRPPLHDLMGSNRMDEGHEIRMSTGTGPGETVGVGKTEVGTEYFTEMKPREGRLDEDLAQTVPSVSGTTDSRPGDAERPVTQNTVNGICTPEEGNMVEIECKYEESQHRAPKDHQQDNPSEDEAIDMTRTMEHLRSLIEDNPDDEQDDDWKWSKVKRLREIVDEMQAPHQTTTTTETGLAKDDNLFENKTEVMTTDGIPETSSTSTDVDGLEGMRISGDDMPTNDVNLLHDLSRLREVISRSQATLMEDIAASCLRSEGDLSGLEEQLEDLVEQVVPDTADDDMEEDPEIMFQYSLSGLVKQDDFEYDVNELLARRKYMEDEGVYEDLLQDQIGAEPDPPGAAAGRPCAAGKALPRDEMLDLARVMLPEEMCEEWPADDLPTITFTPAPEDDEIPDSPDMGFVPASVLVTDT